MTVILADPPASGPTIVSTSEEYYDNNVTVMLEWAEEEGMTYNVNIIPQVPITYTGNTSIQLTLSYNTTHNVSVRATLPCGHEAHIHLQLFYGEFNTQENLGVIYCHYYS